MRERLRHGWRFAEIRPRVDCRNRTQELVAVRDAKAGDALFHNFGCRPNAHGYYWCAAEHGLDQDKAEGFRVLDWIQQSPGAAIKDLRLAAESHRLVEKILTLLRVG